jgi:Rrf2 family protein
MGCIGNISFASFVLVIGLTSQAQSLHFQKTVKAVSFSAKTNYGLVALLELASTYSNGQVLQVAEIAQRQQIPDRYLEQMLTSLRRAGILRSIRGPRGGYQLTKPPADVMVSEVVACLEGEATNCDTNKRITAEFQVLESLAYQLEIARNKLLKNTSLQNLLDKRDQLAEAQGMYFI